MDWLGYCLRGMQKYLATERQTWRKHRQIHPRPLKKGVIWTMQYMFVPGHVRCKKQFLLRTNSGDIISNFGT